MLCPYIPIKGDLRLGFEGSQVDDGVPSLDLLNAPLGGHGFSRQFVELDVLEGVGTEW